LENKMHETGQILFSQLRVVVPNTFNGTGQS
jgi:hypothetical protein